MLKHYENNIGCPPIAHEMIISYDVYACMYVQQQCDIMYCMYIMLVYVRTQAMRMNKSWSAPAFVLVGGVNCCSLFERSAGGVVGDVTTTVEVTEDESGDRYA